MNSRNFSFLQGVLKISSGLVHRLKYSQRDETEIEVTSDICPSILFRLTTWIITRLLNAFFFSRFTSWGRKWRKISTTYVYSRKIFWKKYLKELPDDFFLEQMAINNMVESLRNLRKKIVLAVISGGIELIPKGLFHDMDGFLILCNSKSKQKKKKNFRSDSKKKPSSRK